MDLKITLDKLADELLKEVNQPSDHFTNKLDLFKELRAYYALRLKEPVESPDEDDSSFTFKDGIGGKRGIPARLHNRRSA